MLFIATLTGSFVSFNPSILLMLSTCWLLQQTVYAADVLPIETTDVFGQAEQRHSITEIDLSVYTGFAKVITRDQFEGQFVAISDLLSQQVGVQIKDTGGIGSFNTISIRGSQSKQVNTYLDGMLINSPSSGIADFGSIPTALVERITVYPSITPVQLGHANVAGAINIASRDLINEKGGQISLTTGSFSTYAGELAYWQSFDDFDYIVALGHIESDNDYTVEDTFFENHSTRRRNAGFDQDTFFLKTRKNWGSVSAQWLIQYADSMRELPTEKNKPTDRATRDDEQLRNQWVVDYTLGELSIAHRIYVMSENIGLDDRKKQFGLSTKYDRLVKSDLLSYGLVNAMEQAFGSHRFALSTDFRQDDYTKTDVISPGFGLHAERTTLSLGISDHWIPNDKVNINVTAYYFYIDDTFSFPVAQDGDAYNYDRDVEPSSPHIAPSLQFGMSLETFSQVYIKANAGRKIRSATITEKYGTGGNYKGNPALKHETVDFLETGFHWQHSLINWQATLFYQKLHDGIFMLYDSRGVGRPVNYSASVISGIESDLKINILPSLDLQLRNTYLNSENQTNQVALKGKKLPGIYHYSNYAALNWQYNRLSARISYTFDTELYHLATNQSNSLHDNYEEDRQDLSASMTIDFGRMRLNMAANNILNINFKDFQTLPSVGRSFSTTLTVNF